ncbi:MAG: DUF6152 family protein [Candidatus Rariloculaceae bacterium]
MLNKKTILLTLAGGCLTAALPASGHHSTFNYYDPEVIVEYEDVTAVSFEVMNPHARLVFLVTDDDGNEVEWTATTQSANVLRRMGISADSIRPGDKLTVTASPHREGLNLVLMTEVAWENGDYAVLSIGASGGLFRADAE